MRFYADIQRVDEEQRMVWGYASTEQRALDGLVITREAMSAALDDYMEYANIREMHQPSAAGVAREGLVDDVGLWIGAYIVDDNAWKKVVERVYKGFSIGAKITERDEDDKTLIRGISLREISLVDRPADPGARFDYFRAADLDTAELDEEDEVQRFSDGTDYAERYVELYGLDATDAAFLVELERRSFTEKQRKSMASKGEALPDGSFPIANRQDLENAIRAFGRAKDKRAAKRHIMKRAKALGAEDLIPDSWKGGDDSKRAAETPENPAQEAPQAVERTEAAAEGVEAAPEAAAAAEEGDPANPAPEVVEHAADAAPEAAEVVAEPKSEAAQALEAARAAVAELKAAVEPEPEAPEARRDRLFGELSEVHRSMYDVSRLAEMLCSLAYMAMGAEFEAEIEQDNSKVPGQLRQNLIDMAKTFRSMADEELRELIEYTGVDVEDVELVAGGDVDLQRGAEAEPKVTEPDPELKRLADENDELRRGLGDLADQVKGLVDVVRDFSHQVAPPKTAGSLARVEKGEDAAGQGDQPQRPSLAPEEVQRYLDSLPEEERALTLIRAARARPMSLTDVRSPQLTGPAAGR